jgi:hypothetical protein
MDNTKITRDTVLLTVDQVAERLHCSTHHVGYLRQYGFIEGTRFARAWLYTEDEVNRFINDSIGKDYWNFKTMTIAGAHKKLNA